MHKVGQTPKGRYCVEVKVGAQWKRFDDKEFISKEDAQYYIDDGCKVSPVIQWNIGFEGGRKHEYWDRENKAWRPKKREKKHIVLSKGK